METMNKETDEEEIRKIKEKREKFIRESRVIASVRSYLENSGWKLEPPRGKHEKGPDIQGIHQSGKRIIVEAKGDGESLFSEYQIIHNAFPTLLGQIISRMKEKNEGIIYGVAFPARWARSFSKKIKEMEWAWKTLDLTVFLVKVDGSVEQFSSSEVWESLNENLPPNKS